MMLGILLNYQQGHNNRKHLTSWDALSLSMVEESIGMFIFNHGNRAAKNTLFGTLP
jgi:hypothetical protein